MLVHGDYLCFSCDLVEEFFDIIADSRTYVMMKLLGILKEYDVVERKVINRIIFAICGNVGRECICPLESIGHFVADPAGEKGFPVMIQGNGSASQWVTRFWDRDFRVSICDL